MARIAGIIVEPGERAQSSLVSALAERMADGQHAVARQAGRCALAWIGSDQPAIAEQDGIVACVDGVFYNPEDLDGDVAAGPAAQLIETYRRSGFRNALAAINGDFSVALYDAAQATLWLGRDRVGHRPLFYTHDGNKLAFASRPNVLRALPWVAGGANARFAAVFAGSHYRYFDNQPTESPFEGIAQLPAASYLEFTPQGPRIWKYWQLEDLAEWQASETELAEKYRDLLIDAVGRRLRDSKRPAFTLSGGMDSSSVLACANEITGRRQHAFSSVYSDKTYDESDDIKGFVAEKVEKWHAIPIDDFDLFDIVRKMVRANDEPVATATWLSHFILCEQVAASGFDLLFGGLGGDELNAGEYEYFIFHFADMKRQGRRAELDAEITAWAQYHDHPIYTKNRTVAEAAITKLTDPDRPGHVRLDRERLSRYFAAVRPEYYDLLGLQPVLDHPFSSWLKNRTYQDIYRETAPCCLRAEDRNCLAFGINHADPFLDHRLIEFMFRVPGQYKIRDGITKRLLREAMRGILPEETRTRIKKTGWNAPAHVWFGGANLDRLVDLVQSQVFRARGIYNVPEVLRLIAEHRAIVESGAARENHMMFLWQLLNLELWFQEIVDKPPARLPGA